MTNNNDFNNWSDEESKRGYKVLDPTRLYGGKGYADWVCDWFNWFFSVNPDSHNSGPVVFLKSSPAPKSTDRVNSKDDTTVDTSAPTEFTANYMNRPNIMVAGDRLQIFSDQAILLPVINSFWIATEPYADFGYMRGYTGPNTDNCDVDPNRVLVDFNPIALPPDTELTRDFRISTSVFTAVIPDSGYGVSLKDYIGIPMPTGSYPAIVEGFFILLKFKTRNAVYQIESLARAPDDHNGHYFADLLYEIKVSDRLEKCPVEIIRPARNVAIRDRTLNEKAKHGEMQASDVSRILGEMQASDVSRILGSENIQSGEKNIRKANSRKARRKK